MEIINGNVNDSAVIADIEKSSFTSDKWDINQWESEFNNNAFAKVLLLKDKERIIGYIDFWIMFEQATIAKMCIVEDYRKKGFGSLLLEKALDVIDNEYCLSTTLEVRVSNVSAISLYEKHLFKKVLVKEGYYSDGEDCFYMLRSIGDVYE